MTRSRNLSIKLMGIYGEAGLNWVKNLAGIVYQIEHLRSGQAKKAMPSNKSKHVVYGWQNKLNLATVRFDDQTWSI